MQATLSKAVDIRKIQRMATVRCLGVDMELELLTIAMLVISCMEDIVCVNVYPMGTGMDMDQNAENVSLKKLYLV